MDGEAIVEEAVRRTVGPATTDPLTSLVVSCLERLHARYAALGEGEVATYIPELAKAEPGWFGLCAVTCQGATYESGDTRIPFTIQSISKPLTYGLVLEKHGEPAVRSKIGVEPAASG